MVYYRTLVYVRICKIKSNLKNIDYPPNSVPQFQYHGIFFF